MSAKIFLWAALGRRATKDVSGASAVEFALLLPLLLTILLAIIQFGLTLGNFIQLTDGVRSAGRALAEGRTSTTPYSFANTTLKNGAPGLTFTGSYMTVTVNGTACTSDATCTTAFASVTPGNNQAATLTATYSCNLKVLAIDFAPGCNLSASTTELIE